MLNGIGCSPSNAWGYRPGGCQSRNNAAAQGAPKDASKDTSDASQLLAAAASRQTDAQISITTAEGDTVTIGLHTEADVTYAAYRGAGQGQRPGTTAQSLSISTSQDLEISVQGDLSDAEKADVEKLVKQLGQMIRGMLTGAQSATMDASGEGDAQTTIASFSLHVDRSQTLTVMASIGEPDAGSDTTPTPPAPGDTPAIAAPVAEPAVSTVQTPATDAPAADAAAATGATTPATPANTIASSVLDELMNAAKQSQLDLGRLGRALTHSLMHMLRHMEREQGMDRSRPTLRELARRIPERFGRSAAPVSLAPDAPPEA